ncbi:MAG: hypothetical protein HW402_392 [Dehalococcoidales bacterium]|nr:hypothetical protein [Dehalococcoidales bacterium]
MAEDKLTGITVNLYLYGELARYGGEAALPGSAILQVCLQERGTIRSLLAHLGIPTEKRGITFINGKLSAMPGLQPDMDYVLSHNDRVAFFDLRSMWPFQYRHGAMITDEMAQSLHDEEGGGLHHTYGEQH